MYLVSLMSKIIRRTIVRGLLIETKKTNDNARVAQLVERSTDTRKVLGSTPSARTKIKYFKNKSHICEVIFLFDTQTPPLIYYTHRKQPFI